MTPEDKILSAMTVLSGALRDTHSRGETVVLPEHQGDFLDHRQRIADILTTDKGEAGAEIAAGYIYAEAFGIQQQSPEVARAAVRRAAGPRSANVAFELMTKAEDPQGRLWNGWEPLSTDSKDAILAAYSATMDAKREEIVTDVQSGTQSIKEAAANTIAAGEVMRHASGFDGSEGLKILYEASLDGADQAYQARFGVSPKKDAVGTLMRVGVSRDELPITLVRQTTDLDERRHLAAGKR